jgi:hypothetical protein
VVIEASDTIDPRHQDEQLTKYTQCTDPNELGTIEDPKHKLFATRLLQEHKLLATYLLQIPIEYRAGAQVRINELTRATGMTLQSAIAITKSELDCQLATRDDHEKDERRVSTSQVLLALSGQDGAVLAELRERFQVAVEDALR